MKTDEWANESASSAICGPHKINIHKWKGEGLKIYGL